MPTAWMNQADWSRTPPTTGGKPLANRSPSLTTCDTSLQYLFGHPTTSTLPSSQCSQPSPSQLGHSIAIGSCSVPRLRHLPSEQDRHSSPCRISAATLSFFFHRRKHRTHAISSAVTRVLHHAIGSPGSRKDTCTLPCSSSQRRTSLIARMWLRKFLQLYRVR